MSTTEEMAAQILDLVKSRGGGVSFVEIMSAAGESGKGDYSWEFADNLVLWTGMSEELVDALRMLRSQIVPYPTTIWVYLADGAMLRMPIAKQARDYKKPHWLPVVFNLREETSKTRRAGKKT